MRKQIFEAGAMMSLLVGAISTSGAAHIPEKIEVDPAERIEIKSEKAHLWEGTPSDLANGTQLKQIQVLGPGKGVTAFGALDPDSVIVRHEGRVLDGGKDYVLDGHKGLLGIPEGSPLTPKDLVEIDYAYSLLRLDSLVESADGARDVRRGQSDLTRPQPPELRPGEKRLANIFVEFHSDGKDCEVFPLPASAKDAPTDTTRVRIPRTLAKLKAGEPVTIVCWGDSVTVGGDASDRKRTRYVEVFERRLKEKFPDAEITVITAAVGGSKSAHWLFPEDYQGPRHAASRGRLEQCQWSKVVDPDPDLVTVEFVNDAYIDTQDLFNRQYEEALRRLREIDAEIMLITPHFTQMQIMGFENLREPESRPYVFMLKEFANKHNLAIADASSRWAHLWKEGFPYVTLLNNGINHPHDKGHAIFAEEMLKCFETPH